MKAALVLSALAAAGAFFLGLTALPAAEGLRQAALDAMPATGVENPVTAVLLDYRAYDTLLELFVVVLAVLAVGALAPVEPADAPLSGPVVLSGIGALVPALVLLGGYVLWIGAKAPGGALQGAALWASALILMALVGRGVLPEGRALTEAISALGVVVFALVGVAAGLVTGTPLDWPAALAGDIILGIEVAAAGALAVGLAALYRAGAVRAGAVRAGAVQT